METRRNNLIILTDLSFDYTNPNAGDLIVLRRGIKENSTNILQTPLDVAFAQGKNELIDIDRDIYRVPIILAENRMEGVEKILGINNSSKDDPKRFFAVVSGKQYMYELLDGPKISTSGFYTSEYKVIRNSLSSNERRRLDNLINSVIVL